MREGMGKWGDEGMGGRVPGGGPRKEVELVGECGGCWKACVGSMNVWGTWAWQN